MEFINKIIGEAGVIAMDNRIEYRKIEEEIRKQNLELKPLINQIKKENGLNNLGEMLEKQNFYSNLTNIPTRL